MSASTRSIVVASAQGNGSLGDCAMMYVAAQRLGRKYGTPPAVLFWTGEELAQSGIRAAAVSPLQEHRCTKGGFWARTACEHQDYFRSFDGLREVCAIGADCVDGIYDASMPADLTRMLNAAVAIGLEARLVNFSVSDPLPPGAGALAELRREVQCRVRDPRSRARMEAVLRREVPLTADIAFLLPSAARAASTIDALRWAQEQRRSGRAVIGVSANWMMRRARPDLPARHADALAHVAGERPCAFLFVPHDVRKPPLGSDAAAAQEVFDLLPERVRRRSRVWPILFSGREAKALIGGVDVLFSGRMHAAIAALGHGVPPLCLEYAGKFHGLFDHFGIEGLVLAPDASAEAIASELIRCLDDRAALGAQIRARLPHVTQLAQSTFS